MILGVEHLRNDNTFHCIHDLGGLLLSVEEGLFVLYPVGSEVGEYELLLKWFIFLLKELKECMNTFSGSVRSMYFLFQRSSQVYVSSLLRAIPQE
jgi:hypothetical protein